MQTSIAETSQQRLPSCNAPCDNVHLQHSRPPSSPPALQLTLIHPPGDITHQHVQTTSAEYGPARCVQTTTAIRAGKTVSQTFGFGFSNLTRKQTLSNQFRGVQSSHASNRKIHSLGSSWQRQKGRLKSKPSKLLSSTTHTLYLVQDLLHIMNCSEVAAGWSGDMTSNGSATCQSVSGFCPFPKSLLDVLDPASKSFHAPEALPKRTVREPISSTASVGVSES